MIAWTGPSELDGSPCALVLTGLAGGSVNPKTGPMVQGWIIRTDVDPLKAVSTGLDAAICGGCRHRPRRLIRRRAGHHMGPYGWEGRSCYVNLMGLQSIYRVMSEGRYPAWKPWPLEGQLLRMGGYGDPAVVPEADWRRVLEPTAGHTGYTHQWRLRRVGFLREWCMASVDTEAEMYTAREAGWSTFRVLAPGDMMDVDELACPASAEMGHKSTCAECLECSAKGSSVAIRAHGSGAVHFRPDRSQLTLPVLR